MRDCSLCRIWGFKTCIWHELIRKQLQSLFSPTFWTTITIFMCPYLYVSSMKISFILLNISQVGYIFLLVTSLWKLLIQCHCRKGAPTTPLVTIAMTKLVSGVLEKNNLPGSIFTSLCGGPEIGQALAKDTRIPLVSFTGSSKVLLYSFCILFLLTYSQGTFLFSSLSEIKVH